MIPDIPRQYLDGTAIDNGMRINFADKIFDVSRENAIKRIRGLYPRMELKRQMSFIWELATTYN